MATPEKLTAKQAVSFIHNLPKMQRTNSLENIKLVLKLLDNPQDKVKTIHVTGTNGKGSTCYYLSHLLTQSKQKVGLFVSPFIIEFNERIQINNRPISDDFLVQLVQSVKAVLNQVQSKDNSFQLTEFEFVTVLGFLAFAIEQVDYAIIEVGIGGRFDKTNVITPELAIITSIGMDHKAIIGPTLADITVEKAGIIKRSKPVIIGNVQSNSLKLLSDEAKKRDAPCYVLGQNIILNQQKVKTKNQVYFDIKNTAYVEQVDMALAIQAYELLELPSRLTTTKIVDTLNDVQIPARYQLVHQKPDIVIDGAHNVAAVQELVSYLKTHYQDNQNIAILMAVMKDKDYIGILELLKPYNVKLTTINYPRAATKSDFEELTGYNFEFIDNSRQFITDFKNKADVNDVLIICGSFYFASEVLKSL